MQKLRSKQGITLIALVITIIVLLILAGISIMMLTGVTEHLEHGRGLLPRTNGTISGVLNITLRLQNGLEQRPATTSSMATER